MNVCKTNLTNEAFERDHQIVSQIRRLDTEQDLFPFSSISHFSVKSRNNLEGLTGPTPDSTHPEKLDRELQNETKHDSILE